MDSTLSSPHNGAVLVDSLLCFAHDFRAHPRLRAILLHHFSPASLFHSLRLLAALKGSTEGASLILNSAQESPEIMCHILLEQLDSLCSSGQAPLFAAADLRTLPFRLVCPLEEAEEDKETTSHSGDQLRQIRFLLQDILLQLKRGENGGGVLLPPPLCATSSPECAPPRPTQPRTPLPRGASELAHQPTTTTLVAETESTGQTSAKGRRISEVLQKLAKRGRTEEGLEEEEQDRAHGGRSLQADQRKQSPPSTVLLSAANQPPPGPAVPPFSVCMHILRQLAIGAATIQQQQSVAANIQQQRREAEEQRRSPSLLESRRLGEEVPEPKEEEDEDCEIEGQTDCQRQQDDGDPDESMDMGMAADSPAVQSESSSGGERGMDDEGEKPFCCPLAHCQKKFANKFLLKKHQFIHTGQKPHICPFCKKPFNRKDNLLRHKKTHLQNGMAPPDGTKRRHNMLRGISQELAILNGLLPLGSREGRRQQQRGTGRRSNSKEGEQKGEMMPVREDGEWD